MFRFLRTKAADLVASLDLEEDMRREAVESLGRNASIEVSPKEALRGAPGLERLPPSTRAFITYLPRGSFDETLAAANSLRQRGLRPIPHLTARSIPDARKLVDRLKRLVEEAGVEEILLVAGSTDRVEGDFRDTLQILDAGIIENSGLRALSVAGHPEGHPQAAEAELHRALAAKNAFAARTGMPLTLVTQFFFDAAPVVAWEKRIRAMGNRLPVDLGLHGVTSTAKLLKHALACGVGASVKALGSHSGSVLQFAQIRSPEGMIADLAAAKAKDPACLFRNFHLFPLGGFERTVDCTNNLREGRFVVSPDGRITVGN